MSQLPMRGISCRFNGLFFLVAEDAGMSAMRTSLSKYYQMLAAPLAPLAANNTLAATWTRPRLDRSGQEVYVTVSLACFVDLDLEQVRS